MKDSINITRCPLQPTLRERQANSAINLPLLVSVPHGGYSVPVDLLPRLALTYPDIFPDSDPCTREIFALQDEVSFFHDADIARAVIDLNRADDDLPPRNPDGVVKSHTVLGRKVYRRDAQPDRRLIEKLLARYYYPYHLGLARDCSDPALICGLDCHSMLDYPPQAASSAEDRRPFICLSNCGDENGDGPEEELTCPPELLHLMADCLQSVFPEEAGDILLNTPFQGGHICRHHSRELPWIQVELNRRAYLSEPWFDPATLQVSRPRIGSLREKFLQAFATFCDEAGNTDRLPGDRTDRRHPFSAPSFLF